MRFVPEIVFSMDTSQDYGEHIDKLIDQIHEHQDE
jgi:ribosome-binding factor A